MGKALDVDWQLIELAYIRGEGSMRELAIRYEVSESAIEKRASRGKWKKQTVASLIERVSERAIEKTVESLSDLRARQILQHEAKAVSISEVLMDAIPSSLEQAGPVVDPLFISQLSSALKNSNYVARLNLGAVDPVHRLDVTSGGLSAHESAMAAAKACGALVASGKVNAAAIDVDAMVKLVQQDGLATTIERLDREPTKVEPSKPIDPTPWPSGLQALALEPGEVSDGELR